MTSSQRMTARKVATLISEMRERGASQQTIMFAIDREFPTISFKEFLTGALIYEIRRTAFSSETLH
jgi:hypothetical protein